MASVKFMKRLKVSVIYTRVQFIYVISQDYWKMYGGAAYFKVCSVVLKIRVEPVEPHQSKSLPASSLALPLCKVCFVRFPSCPYISETPESVRRHNISCSCVHPLSSSSCGTFVSLFSAVVTNVVPVGTRLPSRTKPVSTCYSKNSTTH